MNPITAIINAVTPANPLSPVAGGQSGEVVSPLGGTPLPTENPNSLINLSESERLEVRPGTMKTPAMHPSDPRLQPNFMGVFFDLTKAMQFILRRHGEVASKDELRALGELQDYDDRITGMIEKLGVKAVIDGFKDQRKEMARLAAKGDATAEKKFLEADHWDRNELLEEARAKRSVLKQERRNIRQQAVPIATAITARIAATAENVRDELEQQERQLAFSMGAKFIPSVPLQMVSQLVWVPMRGLENPGTRSPREMVQELGIVIETEASRARKKQIKEQEAAKEKEIEEQQTRQKKESEAQAKQQDKEKRDKAEQHRSLIINKAKGEVEALEAAGEKVPDKLRREASGDLRHLVGIGG